MATCVIVNGITLRLLTAQYSPYRENFIWRRHWSDVDKTLFNYVNSTGQPPKRGQPVHTVCCDGDLEKRLAADPSVFRFDSVVSRAGFVCST